jgi:hypothetical protein
MSSATTIKQTGFDQKEILNGFFDLYTINQKLE